MNYYQILQVGTNLAESVFGSLCILKPVLLFYQIFTWEFFYLSADNIDILDETMDGK